jgi:ribulose-phosphate 3-epimerase
MTTPPSSSNLKIHPSLLSCDMGHLAQELALLESAGADGLHIDIMDGHFVPNLTMGPGILKTIRTLTNLTLDVHLMISPSSLEPHSFKNLVIPFIESGADWVTLHWELFDPCFESNRMMRPSCSDRFVSQDQADDVVSYHMDWFQESIKPLQQSGKKIGLALKPHTPLQAVAQGVWDLIDLLLIMTVEPGFGGQKFIEKIDLKVAQAYQKLKPLYPALDISIDGGINPHTAALVRPFGNVLVSGSYIFHNPPYEQALGNLRLA